jgi:hypothetical protein
MTEAEWLTSVNSEAMLAVVRDKGSDRLWRLFAVACLRTIEGRLRDERSRRALDVAERMADGKATHKEVEWAVAQAQDAAHEAEREAWTDEVRINFGWDERHEKLWQAARAARHLLACVRPEVGYDSLDDGLRLPDVIREVFGNPFRWTPIEPAWLAENDGAALKLALAIYGGHAFELLPILADALEDAGCTDDAILAHLHGPGPHVRGCWALDLILGKQ